MTKRMKKVNNSLTIKWDDLLEFEPITDNQSRAFKSWDDNFNLILAGSAGTGKTFIAMYLGIETVLDPETTQEKLVIIRSTVPTRDQGYLPGTKDAKEEPYTAPYRQICSELFGDTVSYQKAISSKKIEVDSTSYLRGTTWNNAVIIVDEMQNLNFQELDTVMTRVGRGSRIIFSGDYKQSDFKFEDEKQGLWKFMSIVEHLNRFDIVNFGWEDIVRSGFVRDYIMTKEMLGL